MTGGDLDQDSIKDQLNALRSKLIVLHKALIDSERVEYEKSFGTLETPQQFLKALINDPWFAWLQRLSGMIVRIDESVAKDAPTTEEDATAIVREVERLLTASESGDEFQKHYYEALQRQPAVVLAHAEVRRTLKSAPRS